MECVVAGPSRFLPHLRRAVHAAHRSVGPVLFGNQEHDARLDLVEDKTGHIQAAAAAAAAAEKELAASATKAAGPGTTLPRRTSRRATKKRASEASLLNATMGSSGNGNGNGYDEDAGESTLTRYAIAQAKKKDREARRKQMLANINGEATTVDGDQMGPQQGAGNSLWDTPTVVAPVSREVSKVSKASRRSHGGIAGNDPLTAVGTTALATALRGGGGGGGDGGGSADPSPSRRGKGRGKQRRDSAASQRSQQNAGVVLSFNAHSLLQLNANGGGGNAGNAPGGDGSSGTAATSAAKSPTRSTSPHTRKVRRKAKAKGGLSKF